MGFDVRGVMLPLQLHDIYFLMGLPIRGIREATHLSLSGRSMLELLVDRHYGGAPYAISVRSLKIERIMDLMTQLVAMMVV